MYIDGAVSVGPTSLDYNCTDRFSWKIDGWSLRLAGGEEGRVFGLNAVFG